MDIRQVLRCFEADASVCPNKVVRWDATYDLCKGKGVSVALLDSGLNWSLPVFKGAQINLRDFSGSGSGKDATGHGTANAALLVGQDSAVGTGLIPECTLLVAKVLVPQDRQKTVTAIFKALRWALAAEADIVILPFGSNRGSLHIRRAISLLAGNGSKLYAAAGNRGPDRLCYPGQLPSVQSVSGLASSGQVLAECCNREEVNLFCWADRVPVPGFEVGRNVSGSSSAVVLAGAIGALELCAERSE